MFRVAKLEAFYPYPPEKVWRAIANRQALAKWLMQNDFEPRLGHKFCFQSQLPGLNEVIYCEVLKLVEPYELAYSWQDQLMASPSIVTWTLTPVDGGTQLHLEHRGYQQDAIAISQVTRHSQSWQAQLTHQIVASDRVSFSDEPKQLGSILLNSYFSGKWEYLLNHKLVEALAQETQDNLAVLQDSKGS
ncbi:SRPBCC family protein [Gloeocapsopsis dulcis]|uniref:Activator of Hsp90 ATPase homologue 1/2-like C-terminal domain-containing protein n=1 Tax=Gloeocapsopsis dulcis AAB1 = 1H9 TaxID=1433147 RepID=A0A6N8FVS7_9CHRO|nr:SRPBCC domain-containing protein [Gloeocapsopsis dulcis]MUL37228.1 hypothetical protein [Gloeocapsopsis dulcis AAB1 = 1H9]WNN90160.1 SRPBCC domain-containing protein [Gloeocapsopsis dulcis]